MCWGWSSFPCRSLLSGAGLFSPLGKLAGRAIYFACVNFFLFLLWAKLSQYLLDRFSRSFYQMEGNCVNFLDPVHFFRFLKGRCHGNQFCLVPDLFARSQSISGSAGPIFTAFAPYGRYWIADDHNVLLFFHILRDVAMATNLLAKMGQNYLPPLHLSLCLSKMEWDIATSMGALTAQVMPLYCVKISWTLVQ